MKFKLEEVVKPEPRKRKGWGGGPDARMTPHGHREGTIRDIIEKIVIDAGEEGITVEQVMDITNFERKRVQVTMSKNEHIVEVPGQRKYGRKRYYYEI